MTLITWHRHVIASHCHLLNSTNAVQLLCKLYSTIATRQAMNNVSKINKSSQHKLFQRSLWYNKYIILISCVFFLHNYIHHVISIALIKSSKLVTEAAKVCFKQVPGTLCINIKTYLLTVTPIAWR